MLPPISDHRFSQPATRLANIPLLCSAAAIALGGLCYYLDGLAPYRHIRGYPKDQVEDGCLWLAAVAATVGIIAGVVGWAVISRSAGRVIGTYRLSFGMALDLLTLLAILITLYVRAILSGANAA